MRARLNPDFGNFYEAVNKRLAARNFHGAKPFDQDPEPVETPRRPNRRPLRFRYGGTLYGLYNWIYREIHPTGTGSNEPVWMDMHAINEAGGYVDALNSGVLPRLRWGQALFERLGIGREYEGEWLLTDMLDAPSPNFWRGPGTFPLRRHYGSIYRELMLILGEMTVMYLPVITTREVYRGYAETMQEAIATREGPIDGPFYGDYGGIRGNNEWFRFEITEKYEVEVSDAEQWTALQPFDPTARCFWSAGLFSFPGGGGVRHYSAQGWGPAQQFVWEQLGVLDSTGRYETGATGPGPADWGPGGGRSFQWVGAGCYVGNAEAIVELAF